MSENRTDTFIRLNCHHWEVSEKKNKNRRKIIINKLKLPFKSLTTRDSKQTRSPESKVHI